MVFWGVEIKSSSPYKHVPIEEESNLHVSQATLGSSPKPKERVLITAKVGDESPVLICSLTAGLLESCPLDLIFDDEVTFSVTGSTSVHLTGYYMPSQFIEEEDDYEGEYDTDEEDEMENDDTFYSDEDEDEDEEDEHLQPVQNSGVIIEEITEEPILLKAQNSENHPVVKVIEVTEGEKEEEEEEDEDGVVVVRSKRPASEEASAKPSKKQATATDAEKPIAKQQKKVSEAKKEDNTTQAQVEGDTAAEASAGKKKKQKKKNKKAENKQAEPEPPASTENQTKAAASSTEKKPTAETEKEKSSKIEASKKADKPEVAVKAAVEVSEKKSTVKKYPNGLEIHNVKFGNPSGNIAKQGKRVFMSYTGRLKSSGKIFDSNVNGKPLSFRLGVGEVIKGWDVGVQGMKVGDKRKLVIPPSMGYGAKGAPGAIPGNAWLEFDIELKDVK